MGFAPISSYNRTAQILTTINASNATGLTVVYQPGIVNPMDKVQSLTYYGFITSLRAMVKVKSLEEYTLPDIDGGTQRTDRYVAIRESEWGQPRYEMSIFLRTSFVPWTEVARVSIQNRPPFYQTDLLQFLTNQIAFEVANDGMIGVQFRDAGFGFPRDGDEVVLLGSVREEVTILPSEPIEATISSDSQVTVGNQTVVVLPANSSRKSASIVNTSDSGVVFVSFNAIAEVGKGIALYANGGSYEINTTNLYRGALTAISDTAGSTLAISEGT